MNGYAGYVLRIDLSARKAEKSPLPYELCRDYIGGRGFAAKTLWDEVPQGVAPFSEANKVIMAAGPFSGLFLPGSGKITFASKSPATGGYGDSNMGGHMAAELKYAGYDMVVIGGKADAPVAIVIDDDKIEYRDAAKYWGKGALVSEKMLKDDLGEDFQICTIGPAGENLVKYACVSHDFGRQAGRTGIGAVLGWKNVKALAIRGSKTIPVHDQEKAYAKGREMYEVCFGKPGFKEWTPEGTAGVTDWVNEVGAFPTRNFSTTYFEGHKNINGSALRTRIKVTDKGCFGCPIPCGKYSRVKFGGKETYVEGPEYETIALLGGNCALNAIEDVAYANYMCDELGLDTISGGNVCAFAIECYEKGILTKEQVGRELKWGDLESVNYLLDLIARREGIGELLSEGVRTASEKLGHGSERFAIQMKGLEWSGYEARWAPAMMLSYMTCDVGGHHNRSWAITHDVASGRENLHGKADKVIELQHTRPLFDALGICRLQWVEIAFELSHYEELFPLVTGMPYDWKQMLKVSERVWNLTRAFSLREVPGFGRQLDYPPARFMEEAIPSGPAQGKILTRDKIDALLDEYYAKRGWNADGVPTQAKLHELGLDFAAQELAASGRL